MLRPSRLSISHGSNDASNVVLERPHKALPSDRRCDCAAGPRSCTIDGEAVACGSDGVACFEMIRRWDSDERVFMWAFDLIELDGDDLRRNPIEARKETLAGMLFRATPGIRFNEHL